MGPNDAPSNKGSIERVLIDLAVNAYYAVTGRNSMHHEIPQPIEQKIDLSALYNSIDGILDIYMPVEPRKISTNAEDCIREMVYYASQGEKGETVKAGDAAIFMTLADLGKDIWSFKRELGMENTEYENKKVGLVHAYALQLKYIGEVLTGLGDARFSLLREESMPLCEAAGLRYEGLLANEADSDPQSAKLRSML